MVKYGNGVSTGSYKCEDRTYRIVLTNKGLRACVRASEMGYNFVFLTWIFINSVVLLLGSSLIP